MSKHESKFKFDLGQEVQINVSGEKGKVTARCEYTNKEPTYEVIYRRTNGTGTKVIWSESELSAAA